MSIIVTDMDGCYSLEEDQGLEGAFQQLIQYGVNDSLSSGSKILKELVGADPSYTENPAIKERLDDADQTYLLTGRPDWGRIRENTEQIIDSYDHEFDTVVMYPGRTIDGEEVVDEDFSAYELFSGDGIPAYKRAVLEELSGEEEIVYIDDSIDCHRATAGIDGITHRDDQLEEIQPGDLYGDS
jgi:hypothetical protein